MTGVPAGLVLGPAVDLGGSGRSQVHRRAVLAGPADWGSTVVVKRFLPQPVGQRAAMGYARELVGQAYLPGAPGLLAHDDAAATLWMSDLGDHPTVADWLLGGAGSPARARSVALRWARTLGASVVHDPEVLAAARGRLGAADTEDRRARRDLPRRGLARLREVVALRHGSAATAQILDAVEWLEHDTRRHVLGPGDACPDNALVTPGGVRLLDLEGAGVRHLALEAAYCAEPFSTCWCVFATPGGLTEEMTATFTAAAGSGPLAGLAEDPVWPSQVRAAAATWVLSSTLWLMDGALADRALGPAGLGPAFRALLVARWRWVARECEGDLPDVAAACREAAHWAGRAWREGSPLTLPRYPAFSGQDHGGPVAVPATNP